MATVRYEIEYVESMVRDAKSDGDSTIEVEVALDAYEVQDAIDNLSHYERQEIFENLIADGFSNDNPAFDAIATLRHKMTTLALYPDMTALDVLDYIEEAIK